MVKLYRRTRPADPASRDPSEARPESRSDDAPGREPDPAEYSKRMLAELDELGRRLAATLGVPVEDVIGRPRWHRRTGPAKPKLTPEQRAARAEAIRAFRRLPRNSTTTLH